MTGAARDRVRGHGLDAVLAGLGGSSGPVVTAALQRLRGLAHSPVPDDLTRWAARCHRTPGFPLLGTGRTTEPYVALQWNGERAARAGLGLPDLVVLTGLVTAWEQDRPVQDLVSAVSAALATRPGPGAEAVLASVPLTADVVTTALCAGLLSGVPEAELDTLTDLAGTLLQIEPVATRGPATRATAAGHTAAAGWLAVQVHLAGLVSYPGAFADTVSTVADPSARPDPSPGPGASPGPDPSADPHPQTPVRDLVAGLT